MSANFYYRTRQAQIVNGSANFAAILASDFAALGLTNAQSDAFGAANSVLQAAWALSSVPETRTSVTVEATRDAIKAMRQVAIPLAKQIVGNPAVSDSQLVALGLLPRAGRTPSAHITAMPVLTVHKTQGRRFTLRVRDAAGPVRGKLPQAVGAIIYSHIGDTPPSGIDGWTCEGPITKDTAIITFDNSVPVGAKVWFAAQWFNTKGVGPGCSPVPAVIGVEGSLAA